MKFKPARADKLFESFLTIFDLLQDSPADLLLLFHSVILHMEALRVGLRFIVVTSVYTCLCAKKNKLFQNKYFALSRRAITEFPRYLPIFSIFHPLLQPSMIFLISHEKINSYTICSYGTSPDLERKLCK